VALHTQSRSYQAPLSRLSGVAYSHLNSMVFSPKQQLKGQCVLLTGGLGFEGSVVLEQLLRLTEVGCFGGLKVVDIPFVLIGRSMHTDMLDINSCS